MKFAEVALSKWGNSQGIRIPKEVLEELSVQNIEDVKFEISVVNNKIILKQVVELSPFSQLFEDFDGDSESAKYDWGDNGILVGKEVF